MRAFIAIELPKEIKDALANLQSQLQSAGADAKWVAPQNLHLTLKFLGEINDKQLEKIAAVLEETAQRNRPFQLSINSLGAFPTASAPRVIWVGVDKGEAECKKIAAEIEEKTALAGIPKEEREFSCHITIARVKQLLNQDKLARGINQQAGYFKEKTLRFSVAKITLFKSNLFPKGPIYEAQKEANFKAN